MGTTAQKLEYLSQTKSKLKTTINYTGAGIDNNTTFRQYDEKLYNGLANSLLDNGDTLFDNLPKIQGNGTNITLNDTAESRMSFLYKGNTEQDGTPAPDAPIPINVVSGDNTIEVCGKNRLNTTNNNGTQTQSNMSVSCEKSEININGNSSAQDGTTGGLNKTFTFTTPITLEAGTYTFSITLLSGSWTCASQSRIRKISLQNIGEISTGNGSTTFGIVTKTLSATTQVSSLNIIIYGACNFDNVVFGVQLEKSSTASTYTPYTGISQEINLGKNLFDVSNKEQTTHTSGLTYEVSNNVFTISGTDTATSNYALISWSDITTKNYFSSIFKVGETYTISTNNALSGLYLQMNYYKTGETSQSELAQFKLGDGSASFTIPNDYGSSANVFLGVYGSATSINGSFSIQLEKGSSASTYSSYFTPIELCKIGDYQDSIFKYEDTIKVPSGYTQVEYIQSSGTQYIDTGISPTTNTGIKIKASCTTENNTDKILIGSRAGSNRFWLDFDGSSSSQRIFYGFGSYYSVLSYSLNTDYEIDFNYNGSKKIIINNTSYNMSGTFDSTGSLPMYIFRANYTSPIAGNFKVYYCQIYNGTTLVRDFIPCIRNSDSAVGLYDLVSKTFFANAGTGTFTYGREVGSWYIKKEIGKTTLNTFTWGSYTNSTTGLLTFRTLFADIKSYDRRYTLSNYFNYVDGNAYNGQMTNRTSNYYNLECVDTSKTANEFYTWLSEVKPELYYILATPTYTKITDTTLLGQLNAIKKSYEGQTNISQVNDDLPFVLNVSVIKKYE